jgi:hypothetical protein
MDTGAEQQTPRPMRSVFERLHRVAWRPLTRDGDGSITASKFAGAPWLSADERWPECPSCRRPMPLFLQLDLEVLPELGVSRPRLLPGMPIDLDDGSKRPFGHGLLQLFYCVTNPWRNPPNARDRDFDCTRPQPCDEATYRPFSTSVLTRVIRPVGTMRKLARLEAESGFAPKEIIGWDRVDDYPCLLERFDLGIDIRQISPEYSEDEASDLFPCYHGDKLGGWAVWYQEPRYPWCPRCGHSMRLIFQLAPRDHITFDFGRFSHGLFMQCPTHKDIVTFIIQRS